MGVNESQSQYTWTELHTVKVSKGAVIIIFNEKRMNTIILIGKKPLSNRREHPAVVLPPETTTDWRQRSSELCSVSHLTNRRSVFPSHHILQRCEQLAAVKLPRPQSAPPMFTRAESQDGTHSFSLYTHAQKEILTLWQRERGAETVYVEVFKSELAPCSNIFI